MSRTWVGLIREERDHPDRGRERWCGDCALWRLAAGRGGTGESDETGETRSDAVEVRWRSMGTRDRSGLPVVLTARSEVTPPNVAAPLAGVATRDDGSALTASPRDGGQDVSDAAGSREDCGAGATVLVLRRVDGGDDVGDSPHSPTPAPAGPRSTR